MIDFVTGLLVSLDWKKDTYNSILVIVNRFTKIVHYKLLKVTMNVVRLAELILDVIVQYHGHLDLIVTNKGLLFNLYSDYRFVISS